MRKVSSSTLQAIVGMAQNGVVDGGSLITEAELSELKQQIINGALPVWKLQEGTSLQTLREKVEQMPLLPAERESTLAAIDALEEVGNAHASGTKLGAQFRALWPRLSDRLGKAADVAVGAGRAIHNRVAGPAQLSVEEIQSAREGSAQQKAQLLQRLISPFAGPRHSVDERLQQMSQLLEGAKADDIADIRASYIQQFKTDPLIHIIGGSFAQPLLASRTQGSLNLTDLARRFWKSPQRGFQNVEAWAVKTYQDIIRNPETGPTKATQKMAQIWLKPELTEDAQLLANLLDKASTKTPLTLAERKEYYARMPFIGIRTRSERPHNDPTLEEQALQHVWTSLGRPEALDQAMATVEAAFPELALPKPEKGQKSVAVVVSSQGAQWQELMGYVMEMKRAGVHVQFFTPEGRPAGFQKDSLSRSNTSALGYGAPEALDPAGPAGLVAKELLANAAAADRFKVHDFDQVYVAGGLGLNEDGVRVEAESAVDRQRGKQTGPESTYKAHPGIAKMINEAADRQLPILAICHGPSVFIADNVDLDVKGTRMAALGPFEAYVAFTGRTGRPFPHMALVHNDARRAGVKVDPVRDATKPSGVVQDTAKTSDGQEFVMVTGPHPASAQGLGLAGLGLMGLRAQEPSYM